MDHGLKCKTIKLSGQKQKNIQDLGIRVEFFDLKPKAPFIKGKT